MHQAAPISLLRHHEKISPERARGHRNSSMGRGVCGPATIATWLSAARRSEMAHRQIQLSSRAPMVRQAGSSSQCAFQSSRYLILLCLLEAPRTPSRANDDAGRFSQPNSHSWNEYPKRWNEHCSTGAERLTVFPAMPSVRSATLARKTALAEGVCRAFALGSWTTRSSACRRSKDWRIRHGSAVEPQLG